MFVWDAIKKHDDPYFFEDKDYVLQQYIGLEDIHGIEIYEGDIIHCMMNDCDGLDYRQDYTAIVKKDECNPCFVLSQPHDVYEYDFIKCNLMELEIIGNIYEGSD